MVDAYEVYHDVVEYSCNLMSYAQRSTGTDPYFFNKFLSCDRGAARLNRYPGIGPQASLSYLSKHGRFHSVALWLHKF